jgi:hypothetical protein
MLQWLAPQPGLPTGWRKPMPRRSFRHHGAEDLQRSSPARARREGQIGCGLMRLTSATDQPRRCRNGAHGKLNLP